MGRVTALTLSALVAAVLFHHSHALMSSCSSIISVLPTAVPSWAVLSLSLISGTATVASLSALCVLQAMHSSVGVAAPTPKQLQEEDPNEHALFRHLPALRRTLAWRKLGNFPTPIHKAECSARPIYYDTNNDKDKGAPAPSPRTVTFHVKREDLSSPDYGGNKVRTLQHQLAVIEAKYEQEGQQRDLVVFGSGGSNQVVATVVHAIRSKLRIPTTALWIADPSDLDNTLNMLSTLSFPLEKFCTWGDPFTLFTTLINKLIRGKSFMLPLGGNNPTGVLGQAGGMIELAEQIEAGELPDCDGVYLAVGSSCTISGLILGVALARNLGLEAFSKPGFALHPVLIHDGFAFLNRSTGLYKSTVSRYIPLTIRHSLHATCHELTKLGGPNVLAEALAILEHETVIHDDAVLTGKYGKHSEASRACARLFDETCSITTETQSSSAAAAAEGETSMAPGLWLCGHFAAKAFAAMCDDLLKEENAGKNMIFWQTKSRVQPRGTNDEWEQLQQMPPVVKAWAQQGRAESEQRPGKVDLVDGSAKDYRGLMTSISVPNQIEDK